MARKKKRKDKGILTYFPPKRRKDIRALIRALGLVFVKAEPTNRNEHKIDGWPIK
jgi:hypothetical protein